MAGQGMKEATVEFLRDEVIRLRSIVVQTKLLHPSGVRLHTSGEAITSNEVKLMMDEGFKKVYFTDPGEAEKEARRRLLSVRIHVADLRDGDVVEEDIPDADIEIGTKVDARIRDALKKAERKTVMTRQRGVTALRGSAGGYADRTTIQPRSPYRADTRVEMATMVRSAVVKPYYVPRVRVVICVEDEFLRATLQGVLVMAGHEVSVSGMGSELAIVLKNFRADIVMFDVSDTADPVVSVCRQLREAKLDQLGILVCVPPDRKADGKKVLRAGATDILPKPPGKYVILDHIRSCSEMRGRRARFAPKPQLDGRKTPRKQRHLVGNFADSFTRKPIGIPAATVRDFSEKGARVEYNLPDWPQKYAYTPHGMHPLHPLYEYARSNPMGREVIITFSTADGSTLELFARFVHLEPSGQFEIAGLSFGRPRPEMKDRLTTITRRY